MFHLTRHNAILNPRPGDLIHRIPAGHAERSPCPPCGTRKLLRAYADPCSFRPLRKRSPRFFCHRQREGFFPPCAGKALQHPEGKIRGVLFDATEGTPSVIRRGESLRLCEEAPQVFRRRKKIPQAEACGMDAISGQCGGKTHSPFLSLARTMVKAGITRPRIPA